MADRPDCDYPCRCDSSRPVPEVHRTGENKYHSYPVKPLLDGRSNPVAGMGIPAAGRPGAAVDGRVNHGDGAIV